MAFVPPTGLIGSEQALQQGLQGALGAIAQGTELGRQDIASGIAGLDPFRQTGLQALAQQAALTGAGGVEAQRQAFEADPSLQFAREEAERALLRNQAAIGGLGGGNVRRELARQGAGFATQGISDIIGRISPLTQIGFGAAGQQAGLGGQAANLAQQAGQTGAQAILGTGQTIAGGRTRAGEQIAGQTGAVSSALADLIARQGEQVAGTVGGTTGSIADVLATAGAQQAGSTQNLANILANIATGSASQVAGLPGLPSLQPRQGALGGIGQVASGIGTGLGAIL